MRYKKNWSMMIFFKLCRQQGERRESARAADASDGCWGRGGQERQGQGDLEDDDDGGDVRVDEGHGTTAMYYAGIIYLDLGFRLTKTQTIATGGEHKADYDDDNSNHGNNSNYYDNNPGDSRRGRTQGKPFFEIGRWSYRRLPRGSPGGEIHHTKS